MATREQIERALAKAEAAGDAEAIQALTAALGAPEEEVIEGEVISPEAVIGTGVGATAGVGGELLRQRMQRLRPGEELLSEAVRLGDVDPDQALRQLSERLEAGQPGTIISETPGTVGQLAEEAIRVGETEPSETLEAITERVETTPARVAERTRKTLGPGSFFEKEQDLVDNLYENAKPLYKAAYEAHPGISEADVPALRQIMDAPDGQRAVRTALRLLKNQGKTMGRVDAIGMVRRPSLEFLDYVKRGFDQIILKEEDKGPTPLGKSMRQLRNQLRDQLDEIAPEYAEARAQFAGDLEVLQALRDGREKFKTTQPEELADLMADMSDAEREAYRAGVTQHLVEEIEKTTTADPVRKVLGSEAKRKRVRELFEDEEDFKLYREALETESRIMQKEKAVARRGERGRIAEQTRTPSVFEELRGGRGIAGVVSRILSRRKSLKPKESDEILRALKTDDPAELDEMARRFGIRERGKPKRPRGKAAAVGAAGAAAGAGLGKLLEGDEEFASGGKVDKTRRALLKMIGTGAVTATGAGKVLKRKGTSLEESVLPPIKKIAGTTLLKSPTSVISSGFLPNELTSILLSRIAKKIDEGFTLPDDPEGWKAETLLEDIEEGAPLDISMTRELEQILSSGDETDELLKKALRAGSKEVDLEKFFDTWADQAWDKPSAFDEYAERMGIENPREINMRELEDEDIEYLSEIFGGEENIPESLWSEDWDT